MPCYYSVMQKLLQYSVDCDLFTQTAGFGEKCKCPKARRVGIILMAVFTGQLVNIKLMKRLHLLLIGALQSSPSFTHRDELP